MTQHTYPATVRLGHRDFRVEQMHEHVGGDKYGLTCPAGGWIAISDHDDLGDEANTFLHECLHGLYWTYGMRETVKTEEEIIVNTLANALCQFIRDNPAAIAYLTKHLSPPKGRRK